MTDRAAAACIDAGSGAVPRTPLATAIGWIDAQVARRGAELAPVAEAAGRVLAEEIAAIREVPPFDRAALAGIALRAAETIGAGSYNPLSFRLVEPGEPLPAGSAAPVAAGDMLPRGADAVVRLEDVQRDRPGEGEIVEAVLLGQGIERAGSHVARGGILFRAGRCLDGYDIGLIASAGPARVPVIERCRVRCLRVGGGNNASAAFLRALIERDGGMLTECRELEASSESIRDALAAAGADIILLVGTPGQTEVKAAVASIGELAIDGVALYPGEAAGLGRTAGGTPVFLLPAAPAEGLWAYELLAGRAIRACGGRNPDLPFRTRTMTTARKIVSAIGQVEVCAIRLLGHDRVEPIASFAETGIAAAARADGFVVIPAGSEGFAADAMLTVHLREGHGGDIEARADRTS